MMLLHEVSQTALAAAVLILGLVILLEIRSFARLRRMVDINLGRVFEQLELLRAESRQMLEAQAKAAARELPLVPPAKLRVRRHVLMPARNWQSRAHANPRGQDAAEGILACSANVLGVKPER